MTDLEFGPVELVLAAFEGDTPKAGVLEAILDLADLAGRLPLGTSALLLDAKAKLLA